MNEYIPRQLSYHVDGEEIPVEQNALLSMNRNIVILGEAGMGKSRLLQSLEGVQVAAQDEGAQSCREI